jgi:hypothetical protein
MQKVFSWRCVDETSVEENWQRARWFWRCEALGSAQGAQHGSFAHVLAVFKMARNAPALLSFVLGGVIPKFGGDLGIVQTRN